jgi:hypothetical protein
VKSTDLLALLQEFHRDKLAMYRRHVAAARHVSDYEFNNTYQYVIAREDMHVAWVRDAILDMQGEVEDVPEPSLAPPGRAADAQAAVIREDRDGAQKFVDRWRPRIEAVTQVRHKNMLRVILGETLEHRRFFDQALAGRTDLLGARPDGASTGGGVLPTRWVGEGSYGS